MAGILFSRHVKNFLRALEMHGATVLSVQDSDQRPARIQIQIEGSTISCLLYLWTVTGGGNNRADTERRIQITNAQQFRLEPGVRTILGGFSEEEEVWCFWDPLSHIQFSHKSPSLQVHVRTLEAATRQGIATQRRGVKIGQETIVAVHPDALVSYVLNARDWHGTEADGQEVSDLLDATEDEVAGFINEAESLAEAQRRERVVNLVRAYRDARFRPAVLRAYGYRCTIAHTSMKLVEAAHIIPISHPTGSDDVTNGLALSVQYHRAYDAGLIGIRGDYQVVVNPQRAEGLREAGLAHGLDELVALLKGKEIRLPAVHDVRPDPAKLRLAMELRGFPREMIA